MLLLGGMEGVVFGSFQCFQFVLVLFTLFDNVLSDQACRVSIDLNSFAAIKNITDLEAVCFRNPSDFQLINSMKYGVSDYENNHRRAYIILGPPGKRIHVNNTTSNFFIAYVF